MGKTADQYAADYWNEYLDTCEQVRKDEAVAWEAGTFTDNRPFINRVNEAYKLYKLHLDIAGIIPTLTGYKFKGSSCES